MGWLDSFKRKPSATTILSMKLMNAAYQCGQAFKDSINNKFGEETQDAMLSWSQVQYEFLFFFTHIAMRYAFERLGHEAIAKLQALLAPLLVDSTTEAWFGHWPDKFKAGIRKEFYHNINVAELEYSKCKKMFPEENEGTKDTLFWELGKNIARLSGYENNPAIIMHCLKVSVEQFKAMELDNLIDAVGKEI
jgi:hypothetical protein